MPDLRDSTPLLLNAARSRLTQVNDHRPEVTQSRRVFKYISLLRFTELGAKNLKKSTIRAHAFDKAATKAGVTIEGQYWTLGRCDGVLILSADSENKILHLLAQLTASGNVRAETMQAFTDREFDALIRS